VLSRTRIRWLSRTSILNRGAVGWRPRELPQFGRLRFGGMADWTRPAGAGRLTTVTVVMSSAPCPFNTATGGAGIGPERRRDGCVDQGWHRSKGSGAARNSPRGLGLAPVNMAGWPRAGAVAPWPWAARPELEQPPASMRWG